MCKCPEADTWWHIWGTAKNGMDWARAVQENMTESEVSQVKKLHRWVGELSRLSQSQRGLEPQ